MINLNDLAVEIAKYEGKKEQVNIAQIKEVLHIALTLLATYPIEEVDNLLSRFSTSSKCSYPPCDQCCCD